MRLSTSKIRLHITILINNKYVKHKSMALELYAKKTSTIIGTCHIEKCSSSFFARDSSPTLTDLST